MRADIVGETSGIFVSKGQIKTGFWVNKQGFAPGEDIVVWVRIENQTKYELKWSRVFIQQVSAGQLHISLLKAWNK